MKANKLSSFIVGVVIVITASLLEYFNIHLAWVALVFFPGIIIFVVGSEVFRDYFTAERISPIWPHTKESWAVLRAAWLRMFICFLGAASSGIFLQWYI